MVTTKKEKTIDYIMKKASALNWQLRYATDLDRDVMAHLFSASSIFISYMNEQAAIFIDKINSDEYLTEDEKQLQIEFISDELYSAHKAKMLSTELAIIGLYKTLEIQIKTAASISKLFSKSQIEELSNHLSLIEIFNEKDINIKSIDFYHKFNELRLINNCIKHEGKVNTKLEAINPSKWIKGSQIIIDKDYFISLVDNNLIFLKNLGSELQCKIK
ncbi:hypothetical protein [Providencia rettgeri]|uniref:hypothetical protein n=1 Tax=Providencia rettgeri TaxID=587 RepID=UPI00235FF322|nr:hypothetical protein [Providencia rettgeri]